MASYHLPQSSEGRERERFGPDVCELVRRVDRAKLHHAIIATLLEVANPDRDVLLFFRELWHLTHGDTSLIVDVERCRLDRLSVVEIS